MDSIYKNSLERLRALTRAANAISEEDRFLPEDMEVFKRQSFYCKFLKRVVTPSECYDHWRDVAYQRLDGDKVFFTRGQCIEAHKEPGHELEIEIHVINKYADPLSSAINFEVLKSIKEEEMREQSSD